MTTTEKVPLWLAASNAFQEGRVKTYVEGLEGTMVLADRVLTVGGLAEGTLLRRMAPEMMRGAERVVTMYQKLPDRVTSNLVMGAMEAVGAVGDGAGLLQRMAEEMRKGRAGSYAGKLLEILTNDGRVSWRRRLGFLGTKKEIELTRDLVLGKNGEWGKRVGDFLLSPYLWGLQLIVLADNLGQTGELLTRVSLQSLRTAVGAAKTLNPRQVADDVELVRSMGKVAEGLRERIQGGVDASPISNLGRGGFEKADPRKLSAAVSDVATTVGLEAARLAEVVERRQGGVARLREQMGRANAAMMGTTAAIAAESGAEIANTMSVIMEQIGTNSWLNLIPRQVVAAALAARVTAEYLLSGSIGPEVSVEIEREASGQFGQLRRLNSKIRVDDGIIEGEFRNE